MLGLISCQLPESVSELSCVSAQPGHLFILCLLPRQAEGFVQRRSSLRKNQWSLSKPPGALCYPGFTRSGASRQCSCQCQQPWPPLSSFSLGFTFTT